MPLALTDLQDRRFTLALGGGGALGFAHVGVLQALEERGLRPAAVAGTSMGAVVGATYALRGEAADLAPLRGYGMRAFAMAVLTRGASYRRLLRRHFTIPAGDPEPDQKQVPRSARDDRPTACLGGDATVGDCAVPFVACAAAAGRPLEPVWLADREMELWRVCAASSALPWVFGAVEVGGAPYRDGGTGDNLPAAALRKFGLPVVSVELGFLPNAPRGGEGQTDRRREGKTQAGGAAGSGTQRDEGVGEGSGRREYRQHWEERLAGVFGVIARHDDLGDLMLQPDLARFSPQSFGRFDELVAAGRECVGKETL